MHDMVFNDAVKDVASNKAEFAIHSGHGALLVSPGPIFVMRRFWVRVVEISDSDLHG